MYTVNLTGWDNHCLTKTRRNNMYTSSFLQTWGQDWVGCLSQPTMVRVTIIIFVIGLDWDIPTPLTVRLVWDVIVLWYSAVLALPQCTTQTMPASFVPCPLRSAPNCFTYAWPGTDTSTNRACKLEILEMSKPKRSNSRTEVQPLTFWIVLQQARTGS